MESRPGLARGVGDPRRIRNVVAAVAALVAFGLVPFLSGLLGAAMMYVLVRGVHAKLARYVPERVSAFLLTAAALVVLLIPGVWLVGAVLSQGSEALQALERGEILARWRDTRVGGLHVAVEAAKASTAILTWLSTRVAGVIGSLTFASLNAAIAFFGLYYLLVDRDRIWQRVKAHVPVDAGTADLLASRFAAVTEALLLGTAAAAILQGLTVGLAFAAVGIPAAAIWGVITAAASVLPVFGSALVWAPGAAYLIATQRFGAAAFVVAVGLVVASNVDNIVRLFVFRRVSGIHPMLTLVGAFAGVRAFGLVGVFVGPLLLSYFLELVQVQENVAGG